MMKLKTHSKPSQGRDGPWVPHARSLARVLRSQKGAGIRGYLREHNFCETAPDHILPQVCPSLRLCNSFAPDYVLRISDTMFFYSHSIRSLFLPISSFYIWFPLFYLLFLVAIFSSSNFFRRYFPLSNFKQQ